MIGFENEEWGHDCLHADFANKYLGGGVLSGGCVQVSSRCRSALYQKSPILYQKSPGVCQKSPVFYQTLSS